MFLAILIKERFKKWGIDVKILITFQINLGLSYTPANKIFNLVVFVFVFHKKIDIMYCAFWMCPRTSFYHTNKHSPHLTPCC